MIDVDLRRYGQDKEYEKFINNLLADEKRNDILNKRFDIPIEKEATNANND